jgi:hypothetical protein
MGAFFCCLDAQNGLTFTGTARRRFSPLSAGSSVLDALWTPKSVPDTVSRLKSVIRRSPERFPRNGRLRTQSFKFD